MERILFAHRGMSTLAPENTLSAFSLCKDKGIKWFECDIDILKDKTLVINHDDTLDRCTNKTGSLYDICKEDLNNIDAGSWFGDDYIGERIPTLDELIELINKYKLNVNFELKSCCGGKELTQELIEGFVKALNKLDDDVRVIVSSFNPLMLSKFKDLSPNTPVGCLFETYNLHDDWSSIMERCRAEYIHPQNKGLTKEMVEKFRSYGYKINVWTVNDLARANQLFNWGVTGIFTDIADRFPKSYKYKENIVCEANI